MLTAGLNSLAMIRFGAFRLAHGGGNGGFALLVFGLVAIGVAVWAASRPNRSETAKS
jgi:phosphotransferase system  glucose/maltose/N-acetylglucosamine-specific IIC component